MGRNGSVDQHFDRRPAVANDRRYPRNHRRGSGRPATNRAARRGRSPAHGRVPALGDHRQYHDQAVERVHVRSDARRPRGRHRRQARRPSPGPGSNRRLEGPDRERQFHGEQSHGPGPQHRRRDDRSRQRRSVQENHGRRARRDLAVKGGHQHDGRSTALLRFRSDACRA